MLEEQAAGGVGGGTEGRAAEAAGFAGERFGGHRRPGDGRIGGDDSGRAALERSLDRVQEIGRFRIRRDLHEHRYRAIGGDGARARRHCLDERAQGVGLLQIAQALGVRRADVDDEVVGERMEGIDDAQAVVGGAVVRRLPVLADVDAERRPAHPPGGGQVARDLRRAVAVEAEAVDDGAMARQAEEPRPPVAGLRLRRHRPDLRERESNRAPGVDGGALLVEAGGEAERVRELDAHDVLPQPRIHRCRRRQAQRPPEQRLAQRRHRQVVGAFGIEGKEGRTQRERVEAHLYAVYSSELFKAVP